MAAAALMANVTLFSSQTIIYHASPFSYIFCLLFRTISFYFILCYLFLFKKQSFPVSMRVLKEFFKQKKNNLQDEAELTTKKLQMGAEIL